MPETDPGQAAFLRSMGKGLLDQLLRLESRHAIPAVILAPVLTPIRSLRTASVLLTIFGIAGGSSPAWANEEQEGLASRTSPGVSTRYVHTKVVHSLEETFVRATDRNLGPALAQVVKRIVVWWMNPRRDLFGGDKIEVVFEEHPNAEPVVLAIWMHSQKHRKNWSAVRYKAEGSRFHRYYSKSGREVELRLKRSPVTSYEQITSLLDDGRGHRGVDFKAPVGTPVFSPFNGVVRRRNWSTRRNGRCLELVETKTGRRAYFLHLHRIGRRIRPGVRVKAGQKIATLGNSGRSSAPHLHYELHRANGRLLNPLRVHRTWRARLSPSETEKAKRLLGRYAEMRTGST